MNALLALFVPILVLMMMSIAFALMIGTVLGKGSSLAGSLFKWEMRMLLKGIQAAAAFALQLASDIAGSVAKQLNPPPKKKKKKS